MWDHMSSQKGYKGPSPKATKDQVLWPEVKIIPTVMFLLYDVLRCLSNCFKHLQIFYIVLYLPYFINVFFKIFKKKIQIIG